MSIGPRVIARLGRVCLAALLTVFTTAACFASGRPVVVIPGIMGSKLCDRFGNVLWGDRSSYTQTRINALRLPFNLSERDKDIHSCGLIETISIIPLLWESNVYSELLARLRSPEFGYKPEDIIIFDYDWRLSNFENAARLKDEIFRRFPNEANQIDIVAHSMGGIVARIYIQSLEGERRVHNLLLFGTPHLGSAKLFARLRDGFEHWPNALSGGLEQIQRTILSFPSTYQLLPMYDQCCGFSETANPVTASYVDILSPETWLRFNWLPKEYKEGQGYEFLSQSLVEAKRLKTLLSEPIFKDLGRYQNIHFIANGFIETWSRVFFHPNSGMITGHTTFGGDGTVILESATNKNPSLVQVSEGSTSKYLWGKCQSSYSKLRFPIRSFMTV
jgi:pimeloyl-ACP methyl ester carboxylesterase